ncbi:MAG: methylenetetrahydrofolate--tRNA-(uracil(54)-C(5))-methyltransferase (FADH(2)-oxidizing) TrmFO [Clostridia bacterium]|nr:methylenetetrahydrofolate--tRNA-(uracil(54)-C(5))-methyltransferase (FADH(2)-oxidizing) TrmFO [Clostridia bacterium]
MNNITVVGAGLAGCEAAWQCARRGVKVTLLEQKPLKKSPAHGSDSFAELCCSNSLRGDSLSNAVGLLKEELRLCDSLIMTAADATRVEAGTALAVDREGFSSYITQKICSHPNITVLPTVVEDIPEGRVIIASGPLTEGRLAERIAGIFGDSSLLSFYDASAPLVSYDSIDLEKVFFACRNMEGREDYINCPMDKEQYLAFREALALAEEAPVHGFEDSRVFEGCMPVEVMARRGVDTLRYGPLKRVGLTDPRTGRWPYAVVQLRRDNSEGSVYNMVGFQTHLKFGEQKRVFSMIPGLENAEFLRYGVMHRNTYIRSPGLLDSFYRLRSDPRISFAGQMTGVEGYVESTASGLYAGIAAAAELGGRETVPLDRRTAIGALSEYISKGGETDFQPMNVNYGIIDTEIPGAGKKEARLLAAERALGIVRDWEERVVHNEDNR